MKDFFVFLINVYILLHTVEAQQNIYSSLYKYSYFKVLSQGLIIKLLQIILGHERKALCFQDILWRLYYVLQFCDRASYNIIYIPMRIKTITWNWVQACCLVLG